MTPAFDFTSLYIPQVSDDAARQTVSAHGCPIIGFDYSDDSMNVLNAFVRVGVPWWHAYRFLNWSKPLDPQLDSVRRGIIRAYTEFHLPLPGVLWIDVEEETPGQPPAVEPRTALHTVMDLVEHYDIKPSGTLVRPGIYTGKWFWDKYLAGYTEPADRGWLLWTTSTSSDPDQALLYGGWTSAEGVQYAENQSSAIGSIDLDTFRDRGVSPPPLPPVRPPGGHLSDELRGALDTIAQRWPQERAA